MKKQLHLTISTILMIWVSLIGYSQNGVGDEFLVADIRYKITATAPPEVMIVVYEGTETEVDIPGTVLHDNETYTVTAIGENTDTFQGGVIRPFSKRDSPVSPYPTQ